MDSSPEIQVGYQDDHEIIDTLKEFMSARIESLKLAAEKLSEAYEIIAQYNQNSEQDYGSAYSGLVNDLSLLKHRVNVNAEKLSNTSKTEIYFANQVKNSRREQIESIQKMLQGKPS